KAQRVRVEVFSKIRAMFRPRRCCTSMPAAFSALSRRASSTRWSSSSAVWSSSLTRLLPVRSTVISHLLALDRAGHAAGAATASTELAAVDRDHLDARPAEHRVGRDVAVVADDDARLDGQEV